MNQVTKLENTNEPVGLLAVIQKASTDPNTDVEKLERLYQLYERDQVRIAQQAFSEAMSVCQSEMPSVARKAENKQTQSKYAAYEAICEAITPIYTKHGFSLSFSEDTPEVNTEIRTKCVVKHKDGHSETHFIDLPVDNAGIKGNVNKTEIHGRGSTFSYARRYLTLMIFNLSTKDDDDGQTAGEAEYKKKIFTEGEISGIEYMKNCFKHITIINEVKDRLADNDLHAAADALAQLNNKELQSIWRAPTKGGIFTLEEVKKMAKDNQEWQEIWVEAIKNHPEVDRSM